LSDGGGMGTSAIPLYEKFVRQSKMLMPEYLIMIIPSRWFAGGKGLDEFRKEMLEDTRIRKIVDFFDSTECFPGVDISGGVCYFLWDKDEKGDCEVVSVRSGQVTKMQRPLLERRSDSFIRFNEAISIVRKINSQNENSFEEIISARKPFGFGSHVNIEKTEFENAVKIYSYPQNGYVSRLEIPKNKNWIDKNKVLIAKAYGERGSFPYLVLSKPFIGEIGSCCSETYLVVGPFDSKQEVSNVIGYIKSKFFRFLVLLKKNTQNAPKGVYAFVPIQDFSESWTDEKLYKKYGLTVEEIAFIESMIRPMDLNTNNQTNEE
jgi:site-specific DNA-methyltransferase (adenine-specific)